MTEIEKNWAHVLDVVSTAKSNVLVVSPRINFPVMEKIMNLIPDSVKKVDCVTRWSPNKAGRRYCDTDVLKLFENREGARLWDRTNIHAKYIRSDDRCLVGSVNLTKRSLGWQSPRNFELMIEVPCHYSGLDEWETALFSDCRLVTAWSLDEEVKKSELLKIQRPSQPWNKVDQIASQDLYWIPLCPCPEKLFGVYAGSIDKSEIASSVYELAQRDLHTLNPPAGCTTEKEFNSAISSRLLHFKFFNKMFSLRGSGISDYHAAEIIVCYMDVSYGITPQDTWKTIKLWLKHFFAEEFKIEVRQKILIRDSMPSI